MASPVTLNHLEQMNDEEFEARTLELVRREFGLGGLARFLRLYRSGIGDYTAERHQWLDGVTVEDIIHDMAIKK